VVGIIGMYWNDGEKLRTNGGLFQGYTSLVWMVVMLQSVGGLLVAVVIKYADNILKGFATSLSIVLSCILSIYLFDFHVSFLFMCGATMVCAAVYLYGTNPYAAPLPVASTSSASSSTSSSSSHIAMKSLV
jgi:UDP-sugar transporter A1/2/3